MKNLYVIPAVLAFFAGAAYAQSTPEFSEADTDQDGALSIEEAKQALPEVVVTDMNDDGMVNKIEAERALPGLMLPSGEAAKSEATVGESDYRMIVQTIQENSESGS